MPLFLWRFLMLPTSALFMLGTLSGKTNEKPSLQLQISGGVDGRLHYHGTNSIEPELEGVFLNLRKVFSDALGDRVILSLQVDADDNFKKIRPYQSYLQLKGPLGKWNIRAGHYLIPFGLPYEYDTERLMLRTLESETLGIKLDTGIETFGYAGNWDWAISLSEGIGRRWILEWETNYLAVGRLGYRVYEWRIALSAFVGRIKTSEDFLAGVSNVSQQKVGIDTGLELESWNLRGEGVLGLEEGRLAGNLVVLVDHSFTDWLDLNIKYDLIGKNDLRHELGLGFSFKLGKIGFFRLAYTADFSKGSIASAFGAQLYLEHALYF